MKMQTWARCFLLLLHPNRDNIIDNVEKKRINSKRLRNCFFLLNRLFKHLSKLSSIMHFVQIFVIWLFFIFLSALKLIYVLKLYIIDIFELPIFKCPNIRPFSADRQIQKQIRVMRDITTQPWHHHSSVTSSYLVLSLHPAGVHIGLSGLPRQLLSTANQCQIDRLQLSVTADD